MSETSSVLTQMKLSRAKYFALFNGDIKYLFKNVVLVLAQKL